MWLPSSGGDGQHVEDGQQQVDDDHHPQKNQHRLSQTQQRLGISQFAAAEHAQHIAPPDAPP